MKPGFSFLRDHHREIIAGVNKATYGFERFRPQGMDDWFLQLTLGGTGQWRFPGGTWMPRTGELVIMKPHTPQDIRVVSPDQYWKVVTVFFRPRAHWLPWLRWPEFSPGLLHLRPEDPLASRNIKRCLLRAARRCWRGRQPRDDFAMAALEEALVWCASVRPRGDAAVMDPRVLLALDFINRMLHRPIAIDEVAHAAGLSRTQLFALFKRDVQQTPLQYLELQRIERAKAMLRSPGASVAQVAASVGYSLPFYFTARFRRHTGMSPREFRNTSRERMS